MAAEKYLSDKKVASRYGVDRSSVWRWAKQDNFPKPKKFYGVTRWKLSDLEHWEQQQDEAA